MPRVRAGLRLVRAFLPAFALALTILALGFAQANQGVEAAGSGATINIEIGDNFFNPKATTVNVGDTIVWTNKGRNPHDVTATNGAFASPRNLAPGATFSYTATAAGTFAYQCTIHVNHDGTLTVQAAAAPSAAPASAAPSTTVPGATPRTGGGGMVGLALQPWQQMIALTALAFAAIGLLTARLVRRIG